MPTPNLIKRGNWIALIAALLVLGAAVVVAKTSRERFSDAHFAVKPAQGSLAEVQLSTARCAKVEVRLCALSAKEWPPITQKQTRSRNDCWPGEHQSSRRFG